MQNVRVNFPGSLGDSSHFGLQSEETRPGHLFRAPGVFFFSVLSRFSHQFGLMFVDVQAIWAVFGWFSCFLGRFPATSSKNMQRCCFAKHPRHIQPLQFSSMTLRTSYLWARQLEFGPPSRAGPGGLSVLRPSCSPGPSVGMIRANGSLISTNSTSSRRW